MTSLVSSLSWPTILRFTARQWWCLLINLITVFDLEMLRQFQRFIRVMDCYADTIRELTTIYCLACLKLRLMSFTIMKLVALVIVLSVAGINSVKAEIKSYEGFKVYAVHYETKRDLESIKYFEHNPLVDFWSSPGINKTNHISVDPSMQLAFEEFLANGNFDFKVLVENVQEWVERKVKIVV